MCVRMIHSTLWRGLAMLLVLPIPAAVAAAGEDDPEPLVVCATTPDLGSLVAEIGGEEVDLRVFTKGPQDPHFLEARPSFIKDLNRADLFLQVGLELESAWAPVLLRSARNSDVLPGAGGYLDASTSIVPLEIPAGEVDRSRGDVHPRGNPHYLLDPANAAPVAEAIAAKLTALRPHQAEHFGSRLASFRNALARKLLGSELVAAYTTDEIPKLLELHRRAELDRFLGFLESRGQRGALGGWVSRMLPLRGRTIVADHNLWPYFARRFDLSVIGFLEPKPGISPTTRHLADLIREMRRKDVQAILSIPYFNRRHAEFVGGHTGATVVDMAHQVGSRPGTGSYLEMVDHNVSRLSSALGRK